ncbi:hypothetical protein B0T26DRAFT_620159, partial [Lasiosphaeria miniovina]
TPVRHRANPNRRSFASPARKTYASENDMTEIQFPTDFALHSPYTPLKALPGVAGQPTGPSSQGQHSKKARSGNKRPKQVSTSPGPAKQAGRSTPPQTSSVRTVTAAAYAGATFHASPAPSSLPIPSFLAKALDSPSVKDAGRVNQEPSPPATDSEALTPKHRLATLDVARDESPLDIFFREDRAEKERARRASSANVLSTAGLGPFSPPNLTQFQSPYEPKTVPNGAGAGRRFRQNIDQRSPSSGISPAELDGSAELDGTPRGPIGKAFSTPYNARILAARSKEKRDRNAFVRQSAQPLESLQPQWLQPPQEQPPQHPLEPDVGERLLQFLAGQPAQASAAAPTPPATTASTSAFAGAQFRAPQSAAPTEAQKGRPAEILDIEDGLRRLLKLEGADRPGPPPP